MLRVDGEAERREEKSLQSSHYKGFFLDETSSVKNAFLIGEINFDKKFNTFENDTHERISQEAR